MSPRSASAALAALLALAAASPAAASRTQLSVFEDDRLLTLSDSSMRERTLDDLVVLGVDVIHSIVFWNKVAPAALEDRRPAGFDGSDPRAYPPELWDRYDALVRGATVRGLDLILSPSSPLPLWASRCNGSQKRRRTCRPDLTQFKRFVVALGTRYSGNYADENQGRGRLPRVTMWSVWNEPNLGSWLSPQYVKRGGKLVPHSPLLYRGLVRAAIKGLKATGHSGDEVLMGETAPLGRRTGAASVRPIAPGDFLRGVMCIDGAGRPLGGRLGAALECGGFDKLAVTGLAHHPYTRGGSRPPTDRGRSNEITISSVSRLKRLLSQASRRGRIRSSLPIWYTEYGFQTRPPERVFGVPLEVQAEYINHSDWLAWQDRSVKSVAQYELRDEANLAGFQTGLRFIDGRAKPGFAAYRMPIWVTRAEGGTVRVWGQVRPAADDALEVVEIQNDADDNGSFVTVKTSTLTNRKGFVLDFVPSAPGSWRLRWTPKDGGPAVTSRVAKVAPR